MEGLVSGGITGGFIVRLGMLMMLHLGMLAHNVITLSIEPRDTVSVLTGH